MNNLLPYKISKLKDWTEKYWQQTGEHAWNYYLGPIDGFSQDIRPPKPLLHIEMECAASQGRLPELDKKQPVTLVILVGESFEPLLQSIWAYQPQRLVPVVNTYYRDREEESPNHKKGQLQWRDLLEQIQKLPDERRPNLASLPNPRTLSTVLDTPSAVFEFLCTELKADLADPQRRVIIDITGAKKPMVAGAFLFAAYTNAAIVYTDFDSYDRDKGKPYGFTCRLTPSVENPFHKWAIPDWERIAQLYTHHDFVGALTLIPEHLPVDPKIWQKKLKTLRQFLTVCSYWENGQLHQAKIDLQKLHSELRPYIPVAVETLGHYWPAPGALRDTWVSKEFLLNPRAIVVYSQDELARVRRLLAEASETRRDYRAAFARAYALHETLIKARIVGSFYKGSFCVKLVKDAKVYPSNCLPEYLSDIVRRWLLELQTKDSKALMNTSESKPNDYSYSLRPKKRDQGDIQIWKVSASLQPDPQLKIPHPWLNLPPEIDADDLRIKRNIFTHTYVPVSQVDVEQVIQLVTMNLEDYRWQWGKWIDPDFNPDKLFEATKFDVPPWPVLKKVCQLDFIPDPDLRS